jgi:hypothetical protein
MQYLRDNAGVLEASADGTTWEPVVLGTGGGGVSDHTLLTNIGVNTHAQLDTHVADAGIHGGGVVDHTLLTNIGVNSHAQLDTHVASTALHVTDHVNLASVGSNSHQQIDSHIADTGIHGGGGASPSVYVCTANRQISIEECNGSIFRASTNGIIFTLPSLASYTGYGKVVLMGSTAFHIYASSGQWIDGLGGSSIIQFHNAQSWANMVLYCAGGAWFYTSKIGTWTEDYLPE